MVNTCADSLKTEASTPVANGWWRHKQDYHSERWRVDSHSADTTNLCLKISAVVNNFVTFMQLALKPETMMYGAVL